MAQQHQSEEQEQQENSVEQGGFYYDPENPPFTLVDFVPPEDHLWVPPPDVPEQVVQSMPDDIGLDDKIELIWGDLPKDEQPNHKRARAAINFRRRKIYEKWLLHKLNFGD